MPLFNLPNNTYENTNLNAVGSQYAADFGHDLSLLVQKLTNKAIFDAAPQQFFDLKLLNMKQFIAATSDEFFYKEMGYQREPLTANATATAVTYPTTQTFEITSITDISEDTVIVFPNNQKGTVIDVDSSTNEITVKPYTNSTLPAVAIGDVFGNLSSIEADGAEGFSQYFRASTVERHNFIQLFHKAMRYGEVELFKMQNQGTTSNFLEMERTAMFRQFRTDLSNAFWNQERGEVTLKNNKVAKATGGIYPLMVTAGSPNTSTTTATLADAFEDIVLSTEFGDYGAVRFAFMHPRIHLELSKAYKDTFVRYTPTDVDITRLQLMQIDIGSSKIVAVPYSRFGSTASFPTAFENRIFILDMKNINLRQIWAERSGDTLSRTDGIPKLYKEMWVDANMGVQFNNPLACGWIDVSL
jgi:hypothetical protein